MWTKFVTGIKALAGTIMVLAGIILIAVLGVGAFAVAAFFFWGIIAIGVITMIVFFVWAFIDEMGSDSNPKED